MIYSRHTHRLIVSTRIARHRQNEYRQREERNHRHSHFRHCFLAGVLEMVKEKLEAAIGIEPMDKGFADLCLTTWLRRLVLSNEKAKASLKYSAFEMSPSP